MNLRQMEVFRAVMLTGSVSGAAELLHVSQPAISKVLAQAVRQSGFALFERVKGRLVPTPEAQQLYQEIDSLWRGVERVRDVSAGLANPQSGMLRLGVSASLASHLVPATLTRLYEQFPRLKSRVEVLIPTIMVDALLDQTAHLGVCLQPLHHPNLVAEQSYRCGFACAMPANHPLASRRVVRPIDLRGHRVITSSPGTAYGQALRRAYGPEAERLHLDIEVRSATTACWYARLGAGVAVVDRAAVSGDSFPGLVIRPFQSRETLEVEIVRNRHRPMSTAQRAFCVAFKEVWEEAVASA